MTSINSIVVFDIDGTLTDSVAVHQKAFEAGMRRFEFPALDTNWSSYRHHTDTGIFEEAWAKAVRPGPADFTRLEAQFVDDFDRELSLAAIAEIAGAGAFVESLPQAGWLPVFATGSLRHGALAKLAALGIDYDPDLLVTASEFRTREDIVSAAITRGCEKHGFVPQRVVSIGDGIWDYHTANALSLDFIGIGVGPKADVLRDLGARVHDDFALGLGILNQA
ncbi:HAD family hydrolase [Devosia sp.]|uniref:HAD family hydrolase n=1 Tax=Devosia sp. TaxID=1871048 RepID=UPI001ACF7210|nr:HAD family hydrolase [Devosia sp.]MBN9332765.1 HAD family hydrolase [Devosia sp.]